MDTQMAQFMSWPYEFGLGRMHIPIFAMQDRAVLWDGSPKALASL
jgi:hypothetical protein